MIRKAIKKVLPVLFIAASGSLWAQSQEAWLSGGVSIKEWVNIGSPSPGGPDSDVKLGSGFRIGLRLDFNTASHIGHELQYAYNRTSFTDNTGTILPAAGSAGMANHQFGYSVLYYTRSLGEQARLRPFLTAGFQVDDFVLPNSAANPAGSVRPGGNAGGGFKVRLSPLFGFRFDMREYVTAKPNWNGVLSNQRGPLFQTEISAGLGVYF